MQIAFYFVIIIIIVLFRRQDYSLSHETIPALPPLRRGKKMKGKKIRTRPIKADIIYTTAAPGHLLKAAASM